MENNFCPKCGAPIEEEGAFCARCGSQISMEGEQTSAIVDKEIAVRTSKNPFTKFIYIALGVHILCLVLTLITKGEVSACFGKMWLLVSPAATLFFSILTVKNSRKYDRKGRAIGIVFIVLSAILIAFSIFGILYDRFNSSENEMQLIESCIDESATKAVGRLKSALKDPRSLKINRIYVIAHDTRLNVQYSDGTYYDGGDFTGYFEVYIDYTANNGFGGAGRGYHYFVYSYDKSLIYSRSDKVNEMPTVTNEVWVLDAEKYNEIASTLPIG